MTEVEIEFAPHVEATSTRDDAYDATAFGPGLQPQPPGASRNAARMP
jgi:hypothetical protein